MTNLSQVQTMSSREIATLCNKQHQHVKRDIETMCQQLALDVSKFGRIYLDSQNRKQTEYLLDKEICLCLVTGCNAKLRMVIIKRWQALEQVNQIALPTTYLKALEALVLSEKAKQALEYQAKLDAPKVAHYDTVAERTNLINASQIKAKVKLSAIKLNQYLDSLGVYNKSIKRHKRTFNHWFIERGFEQMVQTKTGFDQALFTHKGEAWVIEHLISEGVV